MTHYNEEQRAAQLDGSGEESINQVVGARADDVETDTVAGKTSATFDHDHTAAKCYPVLAGSVLLTDGGGAWALGAFAEVVPTSTITSRFDIHHVFVREISDKQAYELVLYQGAGDAEVCRVPFDGIAGGKIDHLPVKTGIIPANARVRAKIATSLGGAKTCEIKIGYHTYS